MKDVPAEYTVHLKIINFLGSLIVLTHGLIESSCNNNHNQYISYS